MPCKACGSVDQKTVSAEMGIHFLGLENIDKPVVWVFAEVVVCFNCAFAEFAFFVKPTCANSNKATPLVQGDVERNLDDIATESSRIAMRSTGFSGSGGLEAV